MNDKPIAEITVFEKGEGPLTKHIELRDGKVVNDSSACRMASGFARRVKIENVRELADLINNFKPSEAYAYMRLGVIRLDVRAFWYSAMASSTWPLS